MTLLPAILLAGVVLAALSLGPRIASRRRLARRARSVSAARPRGGASNEHLFKASHATRLDGLAQRLLPKPAVLRARLEATGLPITIGQYGLASLATGLAFAVLAFQLLAKSPAAALLSGLANAAFLPHAVIGLLMARRRNRFLKVFAEAIGLIVRGIRAGLPVTETIAIVGREVSDPVGEEFRRISEQVRLGGRVEDAMWQTARRIGLPEFNFLVISMSVQRETGGNLAETLENLEGILRRRQQMRLKIRAMSSEATASALIIGSLPFVMALLMSMFSPEYLGVLFSAPFGRLMLMGAGMSLLVGGLIMRHMVRFEI